MRQKTVSRNGVIPREIDIGTVIEHSLRDYHTKGFDYICVKRSETETIKLYFFDGDISKLPEVVNPHDHRYDFDTWTLAGGVENIWFAEGDDGEVFNRFEYRTPLNGGNGFTFAGEARLRTLAKVYRQPGGHYFMRADQLHTIRIVRSDTILMLRQREDVVPLDKATQTFTRGDAPSLSGLYSRFTEDQVAARLRQLRDLTGIDLMTERTHPTVEDAHARC